MSKKRYTIYSTKYDMNYKFRAIFYGGKKAYDYFESMIWSQHLNIGKMNKYEIQQSCTKNIFQFNKKRFETELPGRRNNRLILVVFVENAREQSFELWQFRRQ